MYVVAHIALSSPALAVPVDLAERWEAHAAAVAASSPVPVPFDADDARALAEGRVVAHRFDTPAGAFATGAIWIDAPIEAVWVVIQDGPHDPPGRLSLQRLSGPAGVRRVYMSLDLPFPLADRQWVADIVTVPALTAATGGAVWQRRWDLADPSLAPAPDPSAGWVTENRGAWTLLSTEEGTLALFSVRTVLGGMVPPSIAQSWALGTLKSSLARVAERSESVQTHYVAGHETVLAPGGAPIPPW